MTERASGDDDLRWMRRALELAEQSVGLASPNPAVGCVLVLDGELVGEGFHAYDRLDHAEVVALKQAGAHALGATAYVTLEPCSHRGRTGPCADALIAAGIRRVVVATQDPNPIVRGRGMAKLLAAGVEVSAGVLQIPARKLNEGFARFTQSSLPFVTMKVACSLDGRIADGRIATSGPGRYWITGESAREEVQRMRHSADAVLVGVGTVLSDNPLLTDRSGLPRRRRLLRVVMDSTLRTPLDSQLVASADNDLLLFFTNAAAETQKALQDRGVLVRQVAESAQGRASIAEALRILAEMDITSVLVEGGAKINASILQEGLVDN